MASRGWIYSAFLTSGFAALLYQVVWQRALFSIYGINVESVTMVVTAFMLGLGLGSLAGGAVSRNASRPVLLVFSMVELGIGVFGLASLAIFHAVGDATLGMSAGGTFFVTFLLVLLPTLLMGSTLPLLVAHLVRSSNNVGKTVGTLYFVNTLGSAFASAAAVLGVLQQAGQSGAVRFAALLNFFVAAMSYLAHRRVSREAAAAPRASGEVSRSGAAPAEAAASSGEAA